MDRVELENSNNQLWVTKLWESFANLCKTEPPPKIRLNIYSETAINLAILNEFLDLLRDTRNRLNHELAWDSPSCKKFRRITYQNTLLLLNAINSQNTLTYRRIGPRYYNRIEEAYIELTSNDNKAELIFLIKYILKKYKEKIDNTNNELNQLLDEFKRQLRRKYYNKFTSIGHIQ
jgi:CBS-domain-containing membrane protein